MRTKFFIGGAVGALFFFGCTTVSENQTNSSDTSKPVIIDYTVDNQSEQLKKEVLKLDSQKEYKLSYQLIGTWLSTNYSLDNMQYAIEHAEIHFELLHRNNTVFQKSTFATPPPMSRKEIARESLDIYTEIYTEAIDSIHLPLLGELKELYVATNEIWSRMSVRDKINSKKASEQQFPLQNENVINPILDQYDILKQNMIFYLELLEKNYTINADEAEKDRYFALKKRMENLKQCIMDSRCNFVSYHAISPALAESSKLLYLATFKNLGFDDKQKIKDSVIFLCRSFHKEWLYTASEDVRIQFCDVVKEMKDVVGEAEWKEFETLTTLLDAADNSKKRGASAWWDEK